MTSNNSQYRLTRSAYLRALGAVAVTGLGGVHHTTSARATPTQQADEQEIEVDQLFSKTIDDLGLATSVSDTGETMAYGLADGTVIRTDETGDLKRHPFGATMSATDIYLSDADERMIILWQDNELFGCATYDGDPLWAYEYRGLWDIDTTADLSTAAAVTSPIEGPGRVGLATADSIEWDQPLEEAAAWATAITNSGSHVAVGATEYSPESGEFGGTPGVLLFDKNGDKLWHHETAVDVISIGIDEDRDLIAAGTDDGQLLVFDFDGDVTWSNDDGGYIHLSGDGGTIVSSGLSGLTAYDAEDGDERWTAEFDYWPSEDVTVSEDGTRAFAAYRPDATATIVEEGEVIWTDAHDIGPGVGAIAASGDTWSVMVENIDDETALLEAYRMQSTEDSDATDTNETTDGETESEMETVVDFDWSHPRCPDQEVGALGRYFFGDLEAQGGFHLDDGSGAAEEPSGCVLRTDGDEVRAISLPDGHAAQSETLDRYPRRGETIVFEHYVHREEANMEFRFGVQDDVDSHYAVRFETETENPTLYLMFAEEGTPTILAKATDLTYAAQQFHDFEIEWADEEISVTLRQPSVDTTISADDTTYDDGGIAFYKENTGIIRSYTHLWNNVEVTPHSE